MMSLRSHFKVTVLMLIKKNKDIDIILIVLYSFVVFLDFVDSTQK